jgi:cell division protein FtsI/penicillin-binding protein 2
MRLALYGIFVLGGLLAVRLFYWQIIEWDRLSTLSKRQSALDVPVPARRGDILTRDDLRVATDVYVFTISVSPQGVPDRGALADQLAPRLKQPRDTVLAKLNSNAGSVILARDAPLEIGSAVQDLKARLESKNPELGLASLQIQVKAVRQYPAGAFAAQIIGYVNVERQPAYGIEQYKDQDLRGVDGKMHGAGTVLHDVIPIDLPINEPAIDGSSVKLTINSGIQRIIETDLANAVQNSRATSGSITVLDPKTGAILAMAAYPTADLNTYYDLANTGRYVNPMVSSQYEPGSVFKIVTVAAGLDAGTISPGSYFEDSGIVTFGGIVVRNHDQLAPGRVSLTQVLQQSLNVEAAKISIGLGAERFYQYLSKFGFGVPTRIDLAGEVAGEVKTPGDGKWRDSDLAANSYGQGISVTPLQMVAAVAAVANQGKLMRPYIIQEIQRSDGKVIKTEPEVVRQVIRPEVAKALTQVLGDSILVESTNKAIVPGYRVAGKTGTAQIPIIGGYDPVWTIASFIGYFPADDPKFVILVKLDKPQSSEWGSQVASPVFASVAKELAVLTGLPPDSIRLATK